MATINNNLSNLSKQRLCQLFVHSSDTPLPLPTYEFTNTHRETWSQPSKLNAPFAKSATTAMAEVVDKHRSRCVLPGVCVFSLCTLERLQEQQRVDTAGMCAHHLSRHLQLGVCHTPKPQPHPSNRQPSPVAGQVYSSLCNIIVGNSNADCRQNLPFGLLTHSHTDTFAHTAWLRRRQDQDNTAQRNRWRRCETFNWKTFAYAQINSLSA